jgi:tRNA isopentenyl-2-thiomethyl-A-37 hydroxylase MiaE
MKPRVFLDTSVISAYFDARTPERMAQTRGAWGTLRRM